jgi:glycosyltransferase involved in cell wall biosynthesis
MTAAGEPEPADAATAERPAVPAARWHPRRLHLVENNLVGQLGHFHNLTLAIRRAALDVGVPVTVYLSAHAPPELAAGIGGHRAFPDRTFDRSSLDPVGGALEDLVHYGRRFAAACAAIDRAGASGDDLVLVGSGQQHELMGLAWWLQAKEPDERPTVVVNFHWSSFVDDTTGLPTATAPLVRFAAEALHRSAGPGRALATAHTDQLVGFIAEHVPFPVERLPLPFDHRVVDRPPDGTAPLVVVLGRSLPRKGSGLLPDIGERLAAGAAAPRLWFQVTAELGPGPLQRLRSTPGVETHVGPLDEAEYYERLGAADLVLLPYDPDEYRNRASGVLAEAAAAGKVVVVPAGTWLSEQVDKGLAAGTVYDRLDADAVTGAVQEALRRLDELRALAGGVAEHWRREQSADRFVEELLEAVGRLDRGRGVARWQAPRGDRLRVLRRLAGRVRRRRLT